MTLAPTEVYYDPWNSEIRTEPYPVYRRLRDEAPLYYNEQHDFYAVSRFDDVERVLVDRDNAKFSESTELRGWESLPVLT